MRKRKSKGPTISEWNNLEFASYIPSGSQESKQNAVAELLSWTGGLSQEGKAGAERREEKAEAERQVERAAKRYLFFRARNEAIPTLGRMRKALEHRLVEIENFRRSIDNLYYFEYNWINGNIGPTGPLVGSLQLDLEGAEYNLKHGLELAEHEGLFASKQSGASGPKSELLMDCQNMMFALADHKIVGLSKGDGPLVRLARAVHEYAAGPGVENADFDRAIEAVRALYKELRVWKERNENDTHRSPADPENGGNTNIK